MRRRIMHSNPQSDLHLVILICCCCDCEDHLISRDNEPFWKDIDMAAERRKIIEEIDFDVEQGVLTSWEQVVNLIEPFPRGDRMLEGEEIEAAQQEDECPWDDASAESEISFSDDDADDGDDHGGGGGGGGGAVSVSNKASGSAAVASGTICPSPQHADDPTGYDLFAYSSSIPQALPPHRNLKFECALYIIIVFVAISRIPHLLPSATTIEHLAKHNTTVNTMTAIHGSMLAHSFLLLWHSVFHAEYMAKCATSSRELRSQRWRRASVNRSFRLAEFADDEEGCRCWSLRRACVLASYESEQR